MAKYLVNLSLDGYESEEDEAKAGLKFIEESLDFSGSSVKVELLPDRNPYNRLREIVELCRELELHLGENISTVLHKLKET